MLNKNEEYYLIGGEYTSYYSAKTFNFYNILSKSFLDKLNLTDEIEHVIKEYRGNTKIEMNLGELEGKHSDCSTNLEFRKISFDKVIDYFSKELICDSDEAYEASEALGRWIEYEGLDENIDNFWTIFNDEYDLTFYEITDYYKNNIATINNLILKDELKKGKMLDETFIISFESKADLKTKLEDFIKTL